MIRGYDTPIESPAVPDLVLTPPPIVLSDAGIDAPGPSLHSWERPGQQITGLSTVSVRQSDVPWQIVYGRVAVGGAYSFIRTDVEPVGRWLHINLTYAAHLCHKVVKLFLDNRPVTFGAVDANGSPWGWSNGSWAFVPVAANSYVFISCLNNGAADQVANADLVAQSAALFPGLWTSNHRQRGHAGAYLLLYGGKEKFAKGNPAIMLEVEGKADIYDPRDLTYKYTNNAMLCAADYITQAKWGLGSDYTNEIDLDVLKASADICDQVVDGAARYTLNGVFLTSERPDDVLRKLMSACGGSAIWAGNKWKLYPAAWRAPSIHLYSSIDSRGPASLQTHATKKDLFNALSGKYLNPVSWQVTDAPIVSSTEYATQDGEQIVQDLTLPMVTSSAQSQRLRWIALKKSRQTLTHDCEWSLKALPLEKGDNVYLHDDEFGFDGKLFRVETRQLVLRNNLEAVVKLTLQETAAEIFNDEGALSRDPAPNTALPYPPVIIPPTGLALYTGTAELDKRLDGTIFPRVRVTWTESTTSPDIDHYELQWKRSTDATYSRGVIIVPAGVSQAYINDMPDGVSIDVQLRAVSALGLKSDWVTYRNFLVRGKEVAPTAPENFRASSEAFGILIQWSAIPDLDRDHYVLKYNGTSWEDASVIDSEIRATSYRWTMPTAGIYTFRIKAVDTSGNSSAERTFVLIFRTPAMPVVSAALDGTEVILSWQDCKTDHAIKYYELSYGTTAGANLIGVVAGTLQRLRITWAGVRKFWVRPVDIADNYGTAGSAAFEVVAPGAAQGLIATPIDNNVLLRWGLPLIGTLPIHHYDIKRGNTLAAATLIGSVAGTFASFLETTAGTYTYWVIPVDEAGNSGAASSATVIINQPPDYVLHDDDCVIEGEFYAPTVSETFEEHFRRFVEGQFTGANAPTAHLRGDKDVTLASGNNRVSTWTDQSASAYTFTQGTTANKPMQTRADNCENIFSGPGFYDSEDATGWYLNFVTATGNTTDAPDGTHTADSVFETVDNSSHRFGAGSVLDLIISGVTYRHSIYVKPNGRTALRSLSTGGFSSSDSADFDLTGSGTATKYNGTVSATIEALPGGWYRCSTVRTATSTTGSGNSLWYLFNGSGQISYVGDVTKGVIVWGAQIQNAVADTTYVRSNLYQTLRGVNNRQAILFDGSNDYLSSTATLANIFTAGAKTILAAVRTLANSTTQYYLTCSNDYWRFGQTSANVHSHSNYDTNSDYANMAGAFTSGGVYVLCGTHDTGNITLTENGTAATPTASGNTGNMSGTLVLGTRFDHGGNFMAGDICEIVTFNRALSASEIALWTKLLAAWWGGSATALCLQDLIDAGYDASILQPTTTTPYVTETVVDLGAIIGASVVSVSLLETIIDGSVTKTLEIATSTDGVTYSSYVSGWSQYLTNFRYLKFRLTITGADLTALSMFSSYRYRVDVKRTRDNGAAYSYASHYYGTPVSLSQNYLDIERITVSPASAVRAAEFVRANQHWLSAADHADFSIRSQNFTVCAWVKLSVANQQQVICGKWGGAPKCEWLLMVYPSGSQYLATFIVSTTGSDAVTCTDAVYGPLPAGEWLFIAAEFDYTNSKLRIKINDAAWTETAHAANVYDSDYAFLVGAHASGDYLSAFMRNVHIYKSCLTQEELNVLYYRGLQEYSELALTSPTVAKFVAANSEYLEHADSAALSPTTGLTLAGWFYLATLPGAGKYVLASKWNEDGVNQRSFKIYIEGSDNKAYLVLSSAGSSASVTLAATTFGALVTGAWYYVVARYDGIYARLSINTREDASAYSSGIFDSTAVFRLGAQPHATTPYYLDGDLSTWGLWSRGITDDEIRFLYNNKEIQAAANLLESLKTGLVGYWPLNEASGNRADAYGGNTLTDNNTVMSEASIISPYINNLKVFYPLNEAAGARIDAKSGHNLAVANNVPGRVLNVFGLHNFEDLPNPKKFFETLYTGGVRVSGMGAWQTEGFVNATG